MVSSVCNLIQCDESNDNAEAVLTGIDWGLIHVKHFIYITPTNS